MTEPEANRAAAAAKYATGYGRPPFHTRLRTGQSGNPDGRPPEVSLCVPAQMVAARIFKIP
jgi:hypothetical protein